MTHFLAHWLGMDNPSGPVYAAWSGWGSDITIAAAGLGVMRRMIRHHRERLMQAAVHHRQVLERGTPPPGGGCGGDCH